MTTRKFAFSETRTLSSADLIAELCYRAAARVDEHAHCAKCYRNDVTVHTLRAGAAYCVTCCVAEASAVMTAALDADR